MQQSSSRRKATASRRLNDAGRAVGADTGPFTRFFVRYGTARHPKKRKRTSQPSRRAAVRQRATR